MFGSAILDIAIGLVFVYLLLSLMSSAVTEGIEALLKKRASDLHRGLKELLKDSTGTGLVQSLYKHPLIFGLFQGEYDSKNTRKLPAYIPSRVFAMTLLQIVSPGATGPLSEHSKPASGKATTGGATSTSGAATAAATAPAFAPSPTLYEIFSKIPDQHVREVLLPLVDSAGNDYAKTLEAIEKWYDAAMQRVTGWYRRRTQWFLLAIGFALAVALNADTITLIRSLSRDPASRAALVTAAQSYTQADTPGASDPKARFESSITNLERLGLPIGWDRTNVQLVPQDSGSWLVKVLGWLFTAIAVSLGAPFWFDLMNKFISVRASLKPPQDKPAQVQDNPAKA